MILRTSSTPPGQTYICTVSSGSGQFEVTVGGNPVYPSIFADPTHPGLYKIEISSTDVKCPGPIVIVTDDYVVVEEMIAPCDLYLRSLTRPAA